MIIYIFLHSTHSQTREKSYLNSQEKHLSVLSKLYSVSEQKQFIQPTFTKHIHKIKDNNFNTSLKT